MAITAAALQTELGDLIGDPKVVMQFSGEGFDGTVADTLQHWLVYGGQVYGGRTIKVDTTAADSAATQATTVTDALKAGPA